MRVNVAVVGSGRQEWRQSGGGVDAGQLEALLREVDPCLRVVAGGGSVGARRGLVTNL